MVEFAKPDFSYNYQVAAQINALRDYEQTEEGRAIPDKAPGRLLVATWNIANLGAQGRRDNDHRLIAELISWFDLVAIQEVNDNLAGLRAVQAQIQGSWRTVSSDKAGNDERSAFLNDSSRVTPARQDRRGSRSAPVEVRDQSPWLRSEVQRVRPSVDRTLRSPGRCHTPLRRSSLRTNVERRT